MSLYISRLLVSFLTTITGMVRYKKLSMPFKTLTFYLAFSFLANVANRIVIDVYKTNVIIIHLQTFSEFLFFSFIYYKLFKDIRLKSIMRILMPLLFLFFIVNCIFLQPFYNKTLPSNAMITNEILFVILSLLLFKQMLAYPLQVNIMKQGIFWFNTAVLFFSATMFLNITMADYYYKHNTQNPVLHYFWNCNDILFNFILGVAVFTERADLTE